MKKLIALTLALILCFTMIIPVSASDSATFSAPPIPPPDEMILGDATLDGEVTASDALCVLQYFVIKVYFNEYQEDNSDVDGDGKTTLNDVLLILQYVTGKITEFPANADVEESYVILNKEIIYLKVGEQAELNISDVNLVENPSASPSGEPYYETWTATDDEIVSLQLVGGEEGNAAYPVNLVNQTAVLTGLKAGTTVVKVERGGFGTYAYDECTVVVSDADEDVYMIFDCEDSKGCGSYTEFAGTHWGPVSESDSIGFPAPVQGDYSYCISTKKGQMWLYYNLPESFDATQYDYIELDVYSSKDIVFDWAFRLCTETADAQGSTWGMNSAWMPEDRWYHIKMPISAFGAFGETFGGNNNDINRIGLQITNIVLTDDLMEGDFVTPDYVYIYFDNIVATKDGAGSDNELIDFDTVMNDPPEWYEEYLYNKRTYDGGLKGPDEY